MTADRHHTPPPPAVGNAAMGSTAVCSTAVRGAWWVLGGPVLAVAATPVFLVAGAPADWIGAIWLLAVLWTIGASLVQALWAGFRHGDWSAFSYCADLPCTDLPCAALPRDSDTHDWSTRTGAFAYLRIRDRHEALMREGDRFVLNHDRVDSPD